MDMPEKLKGRTRFRQKGFSLVELLVTVAVFSVVMIAVYGLFDQGNWLHLHAERRSGIQDMARIAIDQMERDMRMIGSGCPTSFSPSITYWLPFVVGGNRSTITFYGDIDNGNTRLAGAAAGTTTVENANQACSAGTPAVLTDGMKTWEPVTCTFASSTTVTLTGSTTCSPDFAPCFITTPEKVSYRLRKEDGTDGDSDNDGICDVATAPFCILQRAAITDNNPAATIDDSDYETIATNIRVLQFSYATTADADLGTNPTGGELFAIGKIGVLMIATDRARMYADPADTGPRTQDFNLNTQIMVRTFRY